jgi:hypothetical protein
MSVLSLKAGSSNVIPDSGYGLRLVDYPRTRTPQGAHTEGEGRCCPRHYSRTCVKTEEDVHLERLSKLERVQRSLQERRHPFQTGDRQLLGDA